MGPRRLRVPVLVPALVVLLGLAAGQAAAATFGGFLRKVKIRTETNAISTSSTSLTGLPLSGINFTTTQTGPVLVQFCGMGAVNNFSTANLVANLDGTFMSPGSVQAFFDHLPDSGGDTYHYRCFKWARASVSPGSHRVKIQWQVLNAGSTVQMNRRLVAVHYNK